MNPVRGWTGRKRTSSPWACWDAFVSPISKRLQNGSGMSWHRDAISPPMSQMEVFPQREALVMEVKATCHSDPAAQSEIIDVQTITVY